MSNKKLILIGGSNIDYIGDSRDNLIPGVSNIGTLAVSFGGVMRNVAENLAFLGNYCPFITAIGEDDLGIKMKKGLANLGMNVYCPKSNLPTSTYIAINDSNHDMALALCDNRIISDLSPEYLESLKPIIEGYEYIAIDTNLIQETIDYIFKTFKHKKILCECISPAKAQRLKPYLNQITLLKGNFHEGQSLSDGNLEGEELIKSLFKKGIKNVVITHGPQDIYIGENNEVIERVEVEPAVNIKNTTGSGDSLFAGVIDKFTEGCSLKEAVEFGHEMAEITLKSDKATNEEIRLLSYQH